jgi:hypothetical protein
MNTHKKIQPPSDKDPNETLEKGVEKGLQEYAKKEFANDPVKQQEFVAEKMKLFEQNGIEAIKPYIQSLSFAKRQNHPEIIGNPKPPITLQNMYKPLAKSLAQQQMQPQQKPSGFKPKSQEDLTKQVRGGLAENKDFRTKITKQMDSASKGMQYQGSLVQRSRSAAGKVAGGIGGILTGIITASSLLS